MNDPTQNADQHVAAISKERLLTLVALVGLGMAVAYFYVKSNSAASDLQQQNVKLRRGMENAMALLAELKKAELGRLEQESVSATKVQQRLADVDRLQIQIGEYREEMKKWQATEADLKTGDLGRRVASNPNALRQYQAIQSQSDPQPTSPDVFQAQLDLLKTPLLAAEASPIKAHSPGPAYEHQLLELEQKIPRSLADMRSRNIQLAAVIAQAPAQPNAGAKSLPEALEALRGTWGAAQNALIAEELQKVREEFDKKLADEKAETQRLRSELILEQERRERDIGEIKQRQILAGLVGAKKDLEEGIVLEAAREALEREFQKDLPQINSLLKPFVTDGRTQPGRHSFEMTVDVGPVSFSKLQGAGALTRTVDAQRKFWSMTTANRTNDRDLGAFPPYVGSAQDWNQKQPTVGRAQELLIKYGPLMVEKGMLAP